MVLIPHRPLVNILFQKKKIMLPLDPATRDAEGAFRNFHFYYRTEFLPDTLKH